MSATTTIKKLRERDHTSRAITESKPTGSHVHTLPAFIRDFQFKKEHGRAPTEDEIKLLQEETFRTLGVNRNGVLSLVNATQCSGFPLLFVRPRKHGSRMLEINRQFGHTWYTPKPMAEKAKSFGHGAKVGYVDGEDPKEGFGSAQIQSTLLHLMALEREGQITDLNAKLNTDRTTLLGFTSKSLDDDGVTRTYFWELENGREPSPPDFLESVGSLPTVKINNEVPEWFIDNTSLKTENYKERKATAQQAWNEFRESMPAWLNGEPLRKSTQLKLFSIQEDGSHKPEMGLTQKLKNNEDYVDAFVCSDTDMGAMLPPRQEAWLSKKITDLTNEDIPGFKTALTKVKSAITDSELHDALNAEDMTWDKFCREAIDTSGKTKHDQITGFNTYYDLFFQLLTNEIHRDLDNAQEAERLETLESAKKASRTADVIRLPAMHSEELPHTSQTTKALTECFHFLKHGPDVWNPAGIIEGDQVVIQAYIDGDGNLKHDYAIVPAINEDTLDVHRAIIEWTKEKNYYYQLAKTSPLYNEYKDRLEEYPHILVTDGAKILADLTAKKATPQTPNCCSRTVSCVATAFARAFGYSSTQTVHPKDAETRDSGAASADTGAGAGASSAGMPKY